MNKEETIQVRYEIEKQDLNCLICLNIMTTPLIHCSNSSHFVCLTCLSLSRKVCPICRSSRLFHDSFLEQTLKGQMSECSNEGCQRLLFKWGIEQHVSECPYSTNECGHCSQPISKATSIKHYKDKCLLRWIDINTFEGASSLIDFCKETENGVVIRAESVDSSFVILAVDVVITFNREEAGWTISILNLVDTTPTLDITYWMPSKSKSIETSNNISIKTGTGEVDIPVIPIVATSIRFEVDSNRKTDKGIDRFFQQLLDPIRA